MALARSTGQMAASMQASGRLVNSMGMEPTLPPKGSGKMVAASDGHQHLNSARDHLCKQILCTGC